MTNNKTNLINARYELQMYIKNLGKYDPERSIVERALACTEKAITCDSCVKACTPPKGYVDGVLKATGKYEA